MGEVSDNKPRRGFSHLERENTQGFLYGPGHAGTQDIRLHYNSGGEEAVKVIKSIYACKGRH